MKMFAAITKLLSLAFRQNSQDITVRPNQSTTYTAARDVQLPPGDADHVLISAASTSTLTNKTIDADVNTISNIENADIKAAAAIALSKLAAVTASKALVSDASGVISPSSVTDTELGYVSGVTSAIQTQLGNKQNTSEKGQPNGYASLDGSGKVPVAQLPNAIMEYQGTWNATTNSPSLADGAGSAGDVYRVSVAGSQDLGSGSISFSVGDYVIYNGSTWEKADTTDAVSSIFGRTGAVVSANGDYTASQITNVPAGNIAAITVQAAIDELDSEKAAVSHSHAISDVTGLQTALDGKLSDAGDTITGDLVFANQKGIKLSEATGGGSNFVYVKAPAALSADLDFILPDSAGSSGQALVTNGSGTLSWATTTVQSYKVDWALADGASKVITHSLNSKDVLVQIYDKSDDATIDITSVVRTDVNTVTLTASEAPGASGWRVIVLKA